MARGNVGDPGRLGFLYLIELPVNRLKIGFAQDVERRLVDSKVYTWVPDVRVLQSWAIWSNWEPHIRQFATDNIAELDLVFGSPSESRSEVFQITDDDAKERVLEEVSRRIKEWITLHVQVYPLDAADPPNTPTIDMINPDPV